MSLPQNEVAADNARRRMEEDSKSPVGGVIENAASLARPALAAASAVISTGASAGTGLAVAGGVVAGLGIVDWFRKLGTAKVNENLESLGQATEDALNRVERVLLEHGTSIDEIKSRLGSQEFRDDMASASLQALRTAQGDRLKRLALILANGVKENDLEPEGMDDMMRAAVELKDTDIVLLGKIYDSQKSLLKQRGLNPSNWFGQIQTYWNEFIDSGALDASKHLAYRSSFSRLESHGLIQKFREISTVGVGLEHYALLEEGLKFYERLQEIA
jgi:DNA-binding transcriptional MerR regulator